ncbi:phytanoyl-CoA dioxygenase [Bradyrhizobium canariense]|uniref:phytanoyl-CoA dioxygenase family protein n=1 Tax=Bradyrhizobium canariense TaxID=255045 RepID=UPI001CA5575C|nr:phytanoyl-CoA dioxygenase family protein [Bradyrhizobium canariense]MBW5435866.1 phytanoyl-CoA dioxygenase [Bradyrhizobium canariense]
MTKTGIARYGVHTQAQSSTALDRALEQIKLVGFAVVSGDYDASDLRRFADAFDRTLQLTQGMYGGRDKLKRIDEHNTIRVPLAHDPLFLKLAMNANILEICGRLIGDYIILNQQNGIVNPPNAQHYNQAAYHRDLPYQHFVSSRPLALNALFCLDPFTAENGATLVVPASHKEEAFPSDFMVETLQKTVTAEAGSFLVLDAMLFHCGGVNQTSNVRRAVNHLYTIPLMRQQIDLPSMLGPDYATDKQTRRLLGYEVQTPRDVSAFYGGRLSRVST